MGFVKVENEAILSIIIPCYNSEKYIGELLNKLCKEDLEDCEIIVVNDGSSDATGKIVGQNDNKSIKLIEQKNYGVSVARNNGIETAHGKYILFLDSDDSFYSGSIHKIKEKIIQNEKSQEAEIIAFGYEAHVDGKIKQKYSWARYDGMLFSYDQINKLYLTKKICFHLCSLVIKKYFLTQQELKFTEGLLIGEDIEFILKMIDCIKGLKYYADKFFIYQIRNDSVMKGYSNYSWIQYKSFVVIKKTIDELMQYDRNRTLSQYYTFFLANVYLSNLFCYLRSEMKDEGLNNEFKRYHYLLREKYRKR